MNRYGCMYASISASIVIVSYVILWISPDQPGYWKKAGKLRKSAFHFSLWFIALSLIFGLISFGLTKPIYYYLPIILFQSIASSIVCVEIFGTVIKSSIYWSDKKRLIVVAALALITMGFTNLLTIQTRLINNPIRLYKRAVPNPVSGEDKEQLKAPIKPKKLKSNILVGFDKCRISDQLSATLNAIFAEEVPIKKESNSRTYSIASEFMGLPIKAIEIGICDSGSRNCGWGSYLALTIAKPFDDARQQLKKQTGIDYTQEKREAPFDSTLRPVLWFDKANHETVLSCDPGQL